ncbi:hypothetical protein F5Y02DRAFT_422867 [Annulohypoxylon stygium]|nr:hypothetical protein F5Y02DRAFT_422867 [Annulohypoxylon stygium]
MSRAQLRVVALQFHALSHALAMFYFDKPVGVENGLSTIGGRSRSRWNEVGHNERLQGLPNSTEICGYAEMQGEEAVSAPVVPGQWMTKSGDFSGSWVRRNHWDFLDFWVFLGNSGSFWENMAIIVTHCGNVTFEVWILAWSYSGFAVVLLR